MDHDALLGQLKLNGLRLASTRQLSGNLVIPSGLFSVDWLLLSVGGIPVGRQAEFFGREAGGKSLLTYRFARGAQELFPDKLVAIFDTEATLQDPLGLSWVARQGVDLDRLAVSGEAVLENIFDQVMVMVNSEKFSLIVVDSLAECVPKGLLEDEEAQKRVWGRKRPVAVEAGSITEFLKAITARAFDTQTTIIYVNQIRDNVGAFFGSSETTPGGWALKHTMALRLRVTRRSDLKAGKQVIGSQSGMEVVKCKFAPAGRKTEVDTPAPIQVWYDQPGDPISDIEGVIHGATQKGLLVKSGAWYQINCPAIVSHDKKVQGWDNVYLTIGEGDWPTFYSAVVDAYRKGTDTDDFVAQSGKPED